MKIIDTHIHCWKLENQMNDWVFNQPNNDLKHDFLPSTLIANSNSELLGFVHVEAHSPRIPTLKEILWLQEEMRSCNTKYKHIAHANLTLPYQQFKNVIDEIKDFPQVVGIRHILANINLYPNNIDLSSNENIKNNLCYLAKNNLIFNCQIYANQLNNLLPTIVNSEVTTIFDHALLPAWQNMNDNENKLWQTSISKIAKLENVYLKLSGLDMFQQEKDFNQVINHCLNTLSVDQLIYGSNYPVSYTKDCNYWYNYLNNNLQLQDEDKEKIFYLNAAKLFNL